MNSVDVAGVNGSIISRHLNPSGSTRDDSHAHHKFLKAVGYQLIDSHIQRRLTTEHLRGPAIRAVQMLGYRTNKNEDTNSSSHVLLKQAPCYLSSLKRQESQCLLYSVPETDVH